MKYHFIVLMTYHFNVEAIYLLRHSDRVQPPCYCYVFKTVFCFIGLDDSGLWRRRFIMLVSRLVLLNKSSFSVQLLTLFTTDGII